MHCKTSEPVFCDKCASQSATLWYVVKVSNYQVDRWQFCQNCCATIALVSVSVRVNPRVL